MWSLLHFVTSTVQSKLPAQQQVSPAWSCCGWPHISLSPAPQPSASSTVVQLQREFVPILNLFSLLYSDREPLPPPDPAYPAAMLDTAMASIWCEGVRCEVGDQGYIIVCNTHQYRLQTAAHTGQ